MTWSGLGCCGSPLCGPSLSSTTQRPVSSLPSLGRFTVTCPVAEKRGKATKISGPHGPHKPHYQSSMCNDHAKTFGQSAVCITGDVNSPRKEMAWQDGHLDHDCTVLRPQSAFTLQSSSTVMRNCTSRNKHLGGLFRLPLSFFFFLHTELLAHAFQNLF